jgi:hypothetical protein
MIDLDDDHLADVLASVGELLVTVTTTRSGARLWRWRVAVAAAAAVVAIGVVMVAVAPLRNAVAGWFGIGSTSIEIDPVPDAGVAPLSSIDAGLRRIDQATAEARLGVPLGDLGRTALGAPAGFAEMPEGGVVVVWPDGSTLWVHGATVDAGPLFEKLVSAGETVQRVDGLGDGALAVSGDHFLRTPHRTVAAATAVLWQSGHWELRLESDRDVAPVIELARQLATELAPA